MCNNWVKGSGCVFLSGWIEGGVNRIAIELGVFSQSQLLEISPE